MFFFFCLFLPFLVQSELIIRDAGVMDVKRKDIAMIFFLTVENNFEQDINISVTATECTDQDMILYGESTGIISAKSLKNTTLIYPNLLLFQRSGSCSMVVTYQNYHYNYRGEIKREIPYNTTIIRSSCKTTDLEPDNDCQPTDCVVKYSSQKNYFNKDTSQCDYVAWCNDFTTFYNPVSNLCMDSDKGISQNDLEALGDRKFADYDEPTGVVNFQCHHGVMDRASGKCICYQNWYSSSCSEGYYRPNLATYHMCNIQVNTWTSANKNKLLLTIGVILVFAILLATKIVIAVCLLNWCRKWWHSRKKRKAGSVISKAPFPEDRLPENCECRNMEQIDRIDVHFIPVNMRISSKTASHVTGGKITVSTVDLEESDISTGDCDCSSNSNVTVNIESDFIELEYTDEQEEKNVKDDPNKTT